MCLNSVPHEQQSSLSPSHYTLLLHETDFPSPPSTPPTPLFDDDTDGPIPTVPFAVKLHFLLEWGESRPVPFYGQRDASLEHIVVPEELQHAAAFPPRRYVTIICFDPDQNEHDISIMPKQGQSFVSVDDVLEVVRGVTRVAEDQLLAGELRRVCHHGESLSRAVDGTWRWRGLREVQDETEVWML